MKDTCKHCGNILDQYHNDIFVSVNIANTESLSKIEGFVPAYDYIRSAPRDNEWGMIKYGNTRIRFLALP